jgi:predicted ATPase
LDQALAAAAHTHLLRREAEAALDQINQAFAISREQGFRFRIIIARLLRGWALIGVGDYPAGIVEISEAVIEYRATGANAGFLCSLLPDLADGYLRAGRIPEGLTAVALGRGEARSHWWQAEVHRLEGDLWLASAGDQRGQAEQCYLNALAMARVQQAKSWQLRAATSLAQLWRDQDRRIEGRKLLASVYGWFTEGFDTADLKEAKSLLDELS